MNTALIIQQTRTWVKDLVIDHAICPFAQREYDRGSIHFCVSFNQDIETCLTTLVLACQHLDDNPEYETTLLILAQGFQDFETFLDLLEIAEMLLAEQGYEGTYQLASFHPHYCFADAPEDDPANYTNRSPYPMLHLLREASIEAALKHYPNPEQIPQRNCDYTRQLGNDVFRKLLKNCIDLDIG